MVERRLDSSSKRLISTALFAAVLIIIFSSVLAFFALKAIKQDIREEIGSSLSVVLDTTTAALRLWYDGQASQIQEAATTTAISEAIATLLDPTASRAGKAVMDEMLHTRLFELQRLQGHRGFDVLTLDGTRLLSTASADIQSQSSFSQEYPEILDRTIREQVANYIPPTSERLQGQERVISHFIAPIISGGKTIAILASHHSPSDELSNIAKLGRIGSNGETYLFNSDGLLITESRFNDDLITANLIRDDESSIFQVSIRDPQVNLTLDNAAPLPRQEQPLTLMAAQAIAGSKGQQLTGYRDYRGVDVIGVWNWLNFLNLGITVEIDLIEAMESYYRARTTILLLLLLSISFALLLGAMLYSVTRRATKLLQNAAQDLNKQVNLRTRELELAAETLRNERELIRNVFNAVPDPIFCKTIDGRFFRVNKAFADFKGRSIEDIEGQLDNQLYTESESEALRLKDTEILTTNVSHTSEDWSTHHDGRMLLFETRKSIVNLDNEKGILAVSRDITDRNFSEEKLKLATENANKANAAKSEFLARMSHEIRTPMNGVLGMLELLNYSSLDKDQQQKVNVAQNSAEGLLTIINDILDFSKIEAGKIHIEKVSFNLRQLVEECAQAFAVQADSKDIELLVDVSQISEDTVAGDPLRLRQVLNNLIGNAIKFTHQGEIFVEASLLNEGDDYVLLCKVKDTGIGIPVDKKNGLFESFSQVEKATTRHYGGTGLGLAISKSLVHLMGGEISVDSQVNQGSCFAFSSKLYVCSDDVKPIPRISLVDWNILIVDDNQTNLDILSALLKKWGATVVTANHVDRALDCLGLNNISVASHAKTDFSLIITDMQMPEKDGLTLVQEVRKKLDNNVLPILMLSSISSIISSSDLFRLGLDGCLTKPVITSDLFNAIAMIAVNNRSNDEKIFVSEQSLHAAKTNSENNIHKVKWPDNTRILLVEDNYINLMVAEGLLSTIGLTCEHAENGLEAIKILHRSESNAPFNLILMDCQMPELDGYEATRQIRSGKAGARYKNVPIIAMTANALKGDKEKCLAAGMDDHIPKPIEVDVLQSRIKFALKVKETIHSARFPAPDIVDRTPPSVPSPSTTKLTIPDDIKTMDWQFSPPSLSTQPQILLKSLDIYIQQYQDIALADYFDPKTSEVLLPNNDFKRLLHTIKGTSGNIGFVHLYELSKQIEENIAENSLSKEHGQQFFALLADSIKDAKSLLAANQKIVTSPIVDSRNINLVISELIPILERSEIVSQHLIDELESITDENFPSGTKQQLMEALDQFDYESALIILKDI